MAKNINVILTLQDRFTKKMSAASYETLMFKKQLGLAQTASNKMAGAMHIMEGAAVAGLTAAGTAAVAGANASLNAYKGFSEKINEVAGIKKLDPLGDEMRGLAAYAKDAAKEINGVKYDDAADTLKYMALAGWDTKQSMQALEPILKAVRINGGDVQTTADAITDSMTALGLATNNTAEYIDKSAAVQSSSNTNMLQLNDALIKCGAMMENLGIKTRDTNGDISSVTDDTMALIGLLASAGKKGTEAGTAIGSLYRRFVKDTAEAQAGLDEIGLSVYNDKGELKEAAQLFEEMAEATKNMTAQERNSALSKIGGRFQNDLMVIIQGMTDVGENGQTQWQKIQKAIENSEGAADDFIKALGSDWGGAVRGFSAAWHNTLADIGEVLAPYATEGLNYITDNILPQISQWTRDEMPTYLEKGKEIVKDIKDALIEAKPTIQWIADHFKEIAVSAGAIYAGMGAFRLGTGAVTAYTDIQKALEGGRKIAEAREAAYGINLTGLTVPGLNKDGSVSKSKRVPIDTSSIAATATSLDIFDNAKSRIPEFEHTVGGGARELGEFIAYKEAIEGLNRPTDEKKGFFARIKELLGKGKNAGGRTLAAADDAAAAITGSAIQKNTITGLGMIGMEGAETGTAAAMAARAAGTAGLEGASVAAMGGIGGGMTASGGLSGLAAALGPLAAGAAIVGGIIVTLVGAYKSSEKFRESLSKFKESIAPGIGKVKDAFKELGPVWEGLKHAGGEFFGVIGDVLAPVVTALGPFVNAFIELAGMGLQALFEGIATALNLVGDGIDAIRQFLGPVFDMLQKIADKFREIIGLAQQGPFASNKTEDYDFSNNAGGHFSMNSLESNRGGNDAQLEAEGYEALGTSYWKGGRTVINDVRGGEIVDLPRGSRIIPADKSEKLVKNMGQGITLNVNIERFYGDDESYINNITNEIAGKLAAVL